MSYDNWFQSKFSQRFTDIENSGDSFRYEGKLPKYNTDPIGFVGLTLLYVLLCLVFKILLLTSVIIVPVWLVSMLVYAPAVILFVLIIFAAFYNSNLERSFTWPKIFRFMRNKPTYTIAFAKKITKYTAELEKFHDRDSSDVSAKLKAVLKAKHAITILGLFDLQHLEGKSITLTLPSVSNSKVVWNTCSYDVRKIVLKKSPKNYAWTLTPKNSDDTAKPIKPILIFSGTIPPEVGGTNALGTFFSDIVPGQRGVGDNILKSRGLINFIKKNKINGFDVYGQSLGGTITTSLLRKHGGENSNITGFSFNPASRNTLGIQRFTWFLSFFSLGIAIPLGLYLSPLITAVGAAFVAVAVALIIYVGCFAIYRRTSRININNQEHSGLTVLRNRTDSCYDWASAMGDDFICPSGTCYTNNAIDGDGVTNHARSCIRLYDDKNNVSEDVPKDSFALSKMAVVWMSRGVVFILWMIFIAPIQLLSACCTNGNCEAEVDDKVIDLAMGYMFGFNDCENLGVIAEGDTPSLFTCDNGKHVKEHQVEIISGGSPSAGSGEFGVNHSPFAALGQDASSEVTNTRLAAPAAPSSSSS